MTETPVLDRDLLRRRHRDHRRGRRAAGADPAALDDVLAADRQGAGQAAGGDPGPLQRGSRRPRPAAPGARRADRQDAAEPQEQREERLAVAGAGKGHSRARGAVDAGLGAAAGRDQRWPCPLQGFRPSCGSARPAISRRSRWTRPSSTASSAIASQAGMPADDAFRRLLARAWNANVGNIQGWPARRLVEPPVKAAVELAWEEFPEGLRRDVDRYLQGLTRVRRSRTGQRIRPLKPSTIRTRRAELAAAARMAVKTGVPIERLDLVVGAAGAGRGGEGLGRLLAPQWRDAQAVHHRSWPAGSSRSRKRPNAWTTQLASASTRCGETSRITASGGLTDKNIALDPAGPHPRRLEPGRQAAAGDDGDRALAAVARAAQSRRHGAARGRDRHFGSGAGAPRQSDGDQARDQPDQAGRAGLQLLARLPGLRRQEPGQAGLPS